MRKVLVILLAALVTIGMAWPNNKADVIHKRMVASLGASDITKELRKDPQVVMSLSINLMNYYGRTDVACSPDKVYGLEAFALSSSHLAGAMQEYLGMLLPMFDGTVSGAEFVMYVAPRPVYGETVILAVAGTPGDYIAFYCYYMGSKKGNL